jgi:antitoxin CcdA
MERRIEAKQSGGYHGYTRIILRIFNAHLYVLYLAPTKEDTMPRRTSPAAVPKRATNVSIRSDLLAAAREAGVNLSATLERALTDELAAGRRKKWREENRDAIQAYNEHVEKHGTFSDDVRSF